MAEMEVRETAPGRVPLAVVGAERQAPDGRRPDAALARRLRGRRRTSCAAAAAGLKGTLAIDGVGKRYSAALVKVIWLDGQSRVYTLTAAQPTVQLYGSADDRRGRGEIARAYTVLGVAAHPERHRPPAVRGRPAVPGRLPAPADRDDHRVHARAQPDAGVQRVRLDHAAPAAGRGGDRAVDRAGGERGAARARHAGAALAGAGVLPVRPGARPRLRRRAEGDRAAAEPPAARAAHASTSASRSAS